MNPPDASRQFTHRTYEALIARAAGLLGGFAANILIARSLGAEGKGLLAILIVWRRPVGKSRFQLSQSRLRSFTGTIRGHHFAGAVFGSAPPPP
jgi:hypothetical protein